MKRIIENIIKIIFITMIIGWIVIIFIDWNRTTRGMNPKFCLKENIKTYKDGETYSCVGLGYKMFRYNRTCSGVSFGPFFIKEYDSNNDVSEEFCLNGQS